ncbi:MAG: hypothetical protein ACTSPW_11075 [Promethearchaeota archaeon]
MTTNITKVWRIIFSIIYATCAILIFFINKEKIFYIKPIIDSYNWYRFLWCLSGSLLGFSVLSFHIRNHPLSPFPSFLTYYPFLLIMISAIVFSVCHLFDKTSGFVFYYISFPICFTLGYLVDNYWNFLTSLIKLKSK